MNNLNPLNLLLLLCLMNPLGSGIHLHPHETASSKYVNRARNFHKVNEAIILAPFKDSDNGSLSSASIIFLSGISTQSFLHYYALSTMPSEAGSSFRKNTFVSFSFFGGIALMPLYVHFAFFGLRIFTHKNAMTRAASCCLSVASELLKSLNPLESQMKPSFSLSCEEQQTIPCRFALTQTLNLIPHLWLNLKMMTQSVKSTGPKPRMYSSQCLG